MSLEPHHSPQIRTFLPVAFSNMPRSLSVIFSFCALYWPGFTAWPDYDLLSVVWVLHLHVCLRHVRAYLLASHLLDLVEGLVEEVLLLSWGALVVVHFCVYEVEVMMREEGRRK
jgi:hypothetical protein